MVRHSRVEKAVNKKDEVTVKSMPNSEDRVNLNDGIQIVSQNAISHSKAAEEYIEVTFPFGGSTWNLWIPIVYRRNGLSLDYPGLEEIDAAESTDKRNQLYDYLNKVSEGIPNSEETLSSWIAEQKEWWDEEHSDAPETKPFFIGLLENTGKWKCSHCLSPDNTNPQRRIQAIKDYGYTLATRTRQSCPDCHKSSTTFVMMIPIERDGVGNGYEQWSQELRKRIIRTLGNRDVYDNKRNSHLLPDHKFPEARWDQTTKEVNADDMPEEQIKAKFQLLTNQHNEEKREACRNCVLSGKRPYPFGIKFYYSGSEDWDGPQFGKAAEAGCVGCCWYDFAKWREALNAEIEGIHTDN